MKKNKFYFAVGLTGLMITTLVVSAIASASSGNNWPSKMMGKMFNTEDKQAIEEAITNNDYTAWNELMGDKGKMAELITEENFARFAEAHQLMADGKFEEAQTIMQELGINKGFGKMGIGAKEGWMTQEQKDALNQAYVNNDYQAWKELMGDKGKKTELITEENFSQYAQAQSLMADGKFEEAKVIMQELGLNQGFRGGMRGGFGWGHGDCPMHDDATEQATN